MLVISAGKEKFLCNSELWFWSVSYGKSASVAGAWLCYYYFIIIMIIITRQMLWCYC